MNKENEKIELTDNDLKQITGGVSADKTIFSGKGHVKGTSTIMVGGKTSTKANTLTIPGTTKAKGTLC